MSAYRRNSLVIDCNVLPARPSIDIMRKFIVEKLKLDLTKVKDLQFNNSKNHVIIETESPEQADELAEQHNMQHGISFNKIPYLIPVYVEDGTTQVKIYDLPPHMPNHLIATNLKQYGDIKSIRKEVWRNYFPGVPNGVKIARMHLKKPIPSFISVEGESAYIVYQNQQRTCRHCSRPLHPGSTCSESAKRATITKKVPKQPSPKTVREPLPSAEQLRSTEEPSPVAFISDTSDDEDEDTHEATIATTERGKQVAEKQNDDERADSPVNSKRTRSPINNKRTGSPTLEENATEKRKEKNRKVRPR